METLPQPINNSTQIVATNNTSDVIENFDENIKNFFKNFFRTENENFSNFEQVERKKAEAVESFKTLEKSIYKKYIPVLLKDIFFSISEQQNFLFDIYNLLHKVKFLIDFPWKYNRITVSFIGPFSAGKTTLLNKIFDLNMPTDIGVATAIPTYLVSDFHHLKPKEEFLAVNENLNLKKKFDISFLDLFKRKEIESLPVPVSAIINYFLINISVEENIQNAIIVDTPGFNPSGTGFSAFDKFVTEKEIKNSTITFLVYPSNEGGMKKDHLEFIEKNFSSCPQKLHLILTKIDMDKPKEIEKSITQIITDLKNKLPNWNPSLPFSTYDEIISLTNPQKNYEKNKVIFFSRKHEKSILKAKEHIFELIKIYSHNFNQESPIRKLASIFKKINSTYQKILNRFLDNELNEFIKSNNFKNIAEKLKEFSINQNNPLSTLAEEIEKFANQDKHSDGEISKLRTKLHSQIKDYLYNNFNYAEFQIILNTIEEYLRIF